MSFNNYGNNFQKSTPIVFNLIIINALVFLAQILLDGQNNTFLFQQRITGKIALYPLHSGYFEP